MANLGQNLSIIRRKLDEPDRDAPSNAQILEVLIEHLGHHQIQLANSQGHWAVGKVNITVAAGQEEYIITAHDFGRPLFVHTMDLNDPHHVRREIPFTFVHDANIRYQGPQQLSGGTLHSAELVAFARKAGSGQFVAIFYPTPSAGVTYTVWYEVGPYIYTGLGAQDNAFLRSFEHLIRVQTALSVLPYCAWGEVSLKGRTDQWQLKQQVLSQQFTFDLMRFQREFDIYRVHSIRENATNILPWGYEYDYPIGGVLASDWGV